MRMLEQSHCSLNAGSYTATPGGAAGKFLRQVSRIAVIVYGLVIENHRSAKSLFAETRFGPGDMTHDLLNTWRRWVRAPRCFFWCDSSESGHQWHVGAAAECFGGLLEQDVLYTGHLSVTGYGNFYGSQ